MRKRNRRLEDYYNDPFPPGETPTQDCMPSSVDYSVRGPGDYVLSGPLYPNLGRGRTFLQVAHARQWAERKFGAERVKVVRECLESGAIRWALLIKGA